MLARPLTAGQHAIIMYKRCSNPSDTECVRPDGPSPLLCNMVRFLHRLNRPRALGTYHFLLDLSSLRDDGILGTAYDDIRSGSNFRLLSAGLGSDWHIHDIQFTGNNLGKFDEITLCTLELANA